MFSDLAFSRAMLLCGLALILAGVPAAAFLPPGDDHDRFEVPLPAIDPHAGADFAGLKASRTVESTLQTRYGGTWRVWDWNAQTGTPRWIFGTAANKSGPIKSEAQLKQAAMQVVSANQDVLGADIADLRLVHAPSGRDKWAAHLQQYWHGYEVWQGKVRLVFHENGNLMVMGSNFHGDITLDPKPALTPGAAADAALADLWYQPDRGDSYQVDPQLLVLPVAELEHSVRHHLVYRVRVQTTEPLGDWVTHVDAHTGQVVWRYNDIHFAFEGTASHVVQPESYCNGTQVDPAAYLRVTVNSVNTNTDVNGNWYIGLSGSSATVTATMRGPYVLVRNANGSDASFSGTAQADVPFAIDWTNSNSRQDERDVFDAVNRIHTFFLDVDASFPYINSTINAHVNRTDLYCPGNAWYSTLYNSIHFCAAGLWYANTGELQQVVIHEYGHGIQNALMGGWQGYQGLGEGNADFTGNVITQESIIARGFHLDQCSSGIRNSLNNLKYPQHVIDQPIHNAGRVIAGFHWDSMVLLQDLYGVEQGAIEAALRWHFGRKLLQPTTQPDQVIATFIADDDNGDLSDGTPHHAIFSEAAVNHGFDDFIPEIVVGMFVYHDMVVPYQTDAAGLYTVNAVGLVVGIGEVDPTSFELHYQLDGGNWQWVPMTADGDGDANNYVGQIPGQPLGTAVRYYVSGRSTFDDEGTSPPDAPQSAHYVEVGHEFYEDAELQTAWIIGLPTDTATLGQWERGIPEETTFGGNIVQRGDQVTPGGAYCFVTGAAAGPGVGAFDVDDGHTTLLSPVFDLTGCTDAEISYWRYYTNEHGANPGIDYWSVDITNDGGQSWASVEYTTASDTNWVQISFDLSEYFEEPGLVRLRFIADDPPPLGSLVEAMVDDLLVVGQCSQTSVGDSSLPMVTFDLSQNYPNPFNPSTQLQFSLERGGRTSLRVFDMRGRLVRTLVSGHVPAGAHTVLWDGQDARGQQAPSGVYLYRLESSGRTIERRMLLVK